MIVFLERLEGSAVQGGKENWTIVELEMYSNIQPQFQTNSDNVFKSKATPRKLFIGEISFTK